MKNMKGLDEAQSAYDNEEDPAMDEEFYCDICKGSDPRNCYCLDDIDEPEELSDADYDAFSDHL